MGEIRNHGMEWTLGINAIDTRDWTLTFNASANTNHNRVASTGGQVTFRIGGFDPATIMNAVTEGKPIGYLYGNKAALRGYGTMFQLSGYADEPIKQRLEIDDGKKVVAVKPGKIQNIYQTLIEGHAKSVVSGKLQNADDAIHNLALCAACHESAKKGGKIIAVKD